MKLLNVIIIFILFFMVTSCGNGKVNEENVDYPVTDPVNTTTQTDKAKGSDSLGNTSQCFVAHVGKDSAFLQLKKISKNAVVGQLTYKFFEKDNTTGQLAGSINLDTLNLTYNFSSEGKTSARQIKLLYQMGNIYEINNKNISNNKNGFVYISSPCR